MYRYAENQDLVNQNSSVIKQQAETISTLEAQISKQQGPGSKSQRADKSKIKELEADVESLKVCLTYHSRQVLLPF